MLLSRLFLSVALLAAPALALAQWQWVDKDGRKVFSDRPPPLDTPSKNILKQPQGSGSRPVVAADPAAAASAAAPSASAASAPSLITGRDKELEAKKKAAEAAEATKRREEQDRINAAKAENCRRAKEAKAQFDSGVRIARTNAKGEREILDDAARAVEAKRHEGVIARDCNGS